MNACSACSPSKANPSTRGSSRLPAANTAIAEIHDRNLIDRIVRRDDGFISGEVVDFIDVSWYAVFDVADMFVVCGCIVLVVYELRYRADAAEPSSGEDPS
ncbi:MAG: signal peptidase II [Acidimicrobiaceae bacterium]|nr:signal peptidase II [Acidimicrobiia bacterium]MCY4494128.1 signal peptidase II [Acidimicrobiaceae bacterium]